MASAGGIGGGARHRRWRGVLRRQRCEVEIVQIIARDAQQAVLARDVYRAPKLLEATLDVVCRRAVVHLQQASLHEGGAERVRVAERLGEGDGLLEQRLRRRHVATEPVRLRQRCGRDGLKVGVALGARVLERLPSILERPRDIAAPQVSLGEVADDAVLPEGACAGT